MNLPFPPSPTIEFIFHRGHVDDSDEVERVSGRVAATSDPPYCRFLAVYLLTSCSW